MDFSILGLQLLSSINSEGKYIIMEPPDATSCVFARSLNQCLHVVKHQQLRGSALWFVQVQKGEYTVLTFNPCT